MGRAFFYLPVPIVGANASSAAAGFDPGNVANDHMGVVWKSAGGTSFVSLILDLGAPRVVDTVAMFGCTGAQPGWEWEVHSSDDAAFTSGVTIHATALDFLAGQALPTHGRGVALWMAANPPAPKRYWRFAIGNLANAAVTIARIALGQRITLARNFAFGGAFGVRDLGSVNFSPSGVRLLRQASKLRTVGITFPAVTKEEAEAKVQPLVEQAAGQLPIVLVTDPDAHPLRQRRCWFGQLTGELGTIWRSAQSWEWRASLIDLVPIPAGAGGAIDVTEPSITSPATFTVDENVALNQNATANTAVTWSKGGLDAGLITLNSATGAWSLPAQDYEARQSVSFVLSATKQGNGLSASQIITITINDVADGGVNPPVEDELVSFSISAPSAQNEGNAGATTFTFPVSRSGALAFTCKVDWAAQGNGGSPANAADFVGGVLPSGTLTFGPNVLTQNISVSVAGDTANEPDEGFQVVLSSPRTVGELGGASASTLILNDDAAGGSGFNGLLVEGDSITSGSPGVSNGSYAWLYKDANPGETINIRAQGSRALGNSGNLNDGGNTLYGHRSEDLAYNAGTWSVFIGANDLSGTTYASGQAYFDALVAYMAPIRAAGVKVALASILPFDSRHPQAATHNTKRAAFNTVLLNNLSQVADYLIPFGSIPEFNTGADPLPVLSDGVHLSPTGINLTAEVYAAVMDAIRTNAIATVPSGSAWFGADINGAAQGAVIERRYVVKGLAPGSTASFSVAGTGGRIKVGAGAYGTSSLTVRNGDVAMLEFTASGSLSTGRTVNITMGGATQSVTVTTAATAPATTTWSTTDKNQNAVIVANSDNRVMSGAPDVGGPMVVRSTTSRSSGKVRAQFIVEASGDTPALGVVNGTQSLAAYEVTGRGNDNGVSYFQDGIFDATGGSAYTFFNLPSVAAGDKIDVLIDLEADRMWYLLNGSPLHGDPAAGTGGAVIPTGAIFLQASVNGPNGRIRLNAGQEAFLGNYPAFAAWG